MRTTLILGFVMLGACTSAATTTTQVVDTTVVVPPTTVAESTTIPGSGSTTTLGQPTAGDGPEATRPTGDVFLKTDLERFRSSTDILLSRDEAGVDVIISSSVGAAYVRSPESIEATITSGERVAHVIGIDNTFWIDDGTGWQETPAAAQLLSLTSVTALTPETLAPILDQLTNVGVEDVNGRPAVHYQGGTTDIQTWLGGSPELDQFSTLDVGSIDVWIDEAGFVTKAIYVFGGTRLNSSATEYYRAAFELFDFDADFEIVPPL